MHFVAQQALCNALGASGLHWVWAIDATPGPRLRFVRRQVNGKPHAAFKFREHAARAIGAARTSVTKGAFSTTRDDKLLQSCIINIVIVSNLKQACLVFFA
jgi:hypothetical protein